MSFLNTKIKCQTALTDVLLKLMLLLITLSVFIPFSPKMPAPGLDPSWALALNQAIAQGLSFGKDIMFTLGPYSSIYTKSYHPATGFMMFVGSCYLALSYWFCLSLLMRKIQWRWILALGIMLFGMIYARDSLLFSYPLLAGIASVKCLIEHNKTPTMFWIILFSPLGLLPLIKGSLLILTITVLLLLFILLILLQKINIVFLCITTVLSSLSLFWLCADQSLANLPPFILSSFDMASGFTEAMSLEGDTKEILLYLLNAMLLLIPILGQKHIAIIPRLFLFSLFFVFLFLSFKAGFTRHYGHAFIAGTSILIASLYLPFLIKSKIIYPIVLCSLTTWSYIEGHYTHISIRNNILSTYSSTWHGLKSIITNKHWLTQNYSLSMAFLKEQASFPIIKGTVDIYSYNQAYLIASENTWRPRPIFQSYSVFTPALAEKNQQYLLSEHSPDTIFFNIEPIDGKMPSMDEGSSWPILLTHYTPIQEVKGFLVIQKLDKTKQQNPSVQLLSSQPHQLGEKVEIPHTHSPVFARIEIKPTLWGKWINVVYKPSPLYLTLELVNGEQKQFRIAANMANNEFLISPLIENTHEFSLLFKNNNELNNKKVKCIIVSTNQSNLKHWNETYTQYFSLFSQ